MSYNNIIKKEEAKKDIEHIELPETEYISKNKYDISEVVSKAEEEGNYDLEELRKEVLDIAHKEIDLERKKILKQANEEAELIKENTYNETYKEAYEKGYSEGRMVGEEESQTIKKQVIRQYEDAEKYVDTYLKDNEKKIIDLSLDMAESIVNYSLEEDKENIIKMLTPILRSYDKQSNIVISCHPKRQKYLEEKMQDLENKSPGSKIILLADESLNENDVILETDYQIIDMGIKKQLESILTKINHME